MRRPCSSCPWRLENHDKPHPDGWFTEANRKRLWAKLRRGEPMSCHRTDPDNEVPTGVAPVPSGTQALECMGALILQQREFMRFQTLALAQPTAKGYQAYRRQYPGGMTTEGLRLLVERAVFGLAGMALQMDRPELKRSGHRP